MQDLIEKMKSDMLSAQIHAFNEGYALGRQYGEQIYGGENGGA